jgi:hypothetical protein
MTQMAGRPPKPTRLLELTGSVRKNPGRYKARSAEPQPPQIPVGGPPDKFMIFHPDFGYQDAERLRAIWDNCLKMWPWITFSDRDALEHYCQLKLKQDKGTLKNAELAALIKIRSELGGTGTGRVRLGVKAAGEDGHRNGAKPADPRVAYLQRKFG